MAAPCGETDGSRLKPREGLKNHLTCHYGAEDGIRTRDPHLGKVMDLVHLVPATPLECGSVHPVSSPSTASAAVLERSTIRANERRREIEQTCSWDCCENYHSGSGGIERVSPNGTFGQDSL